MLGSPLTKPRPGVLEALFSLLSSRDPSVVVGPGIGEDAAVIELDETRVLVAHVDPVTGASRLLGWLGVHVAANDVAATGARPRWLLVALLVPSGSGPETIEAVMRDAARAAREIGPSIVGGHTEHAPGVEKPVIAVTAIGVAGRDSFVATRGARPGDALVLTKYAAMEAAAVLATDYSEELRRRGVGEEVLREAARLQEMVSVVPEALLLAENKLASSMHDPTEGGVLGGAAEIAYASGTTIRLYEEKVLLHPAAKEVLEAMNLDPLRSLSSGALLATIPREKLGEAISKLESVGVRATVIGEVIEYKGHLVELHRVNGVVETLEEPYVEDEVMKLWERRGE